MFNVLNKSPTLPETLSSEGKDFLRWCFQRNPVDRPPATWLLDHPFLHSSHNQDVSVCMREFSGMNITVSTKFQHALVVTSFFLLPRVCAQTIE